MESDNGKSDALGDKSPRARLGTLLPGDGVELLGAGSRAVRTVLLCSEVVEDRIYHWRWLFLDDGSLVEVSPDGYFWYREHREVPPGSSLYEQLVAKDGALVHFEEWVRSGRSGPPVLVGIDAKEYQLTGTGTVDVQRLGDPPGQEVWAALDPDPDENVYFGLVDTANEAKVILGLWTSQVCLSFGAELGEADVIAVHRKGKG